MSIKISNIEFTYGGKQPVLRDISFSINKGETLAIVGASGCGKSTLLRIISGILSGSVDNQIKGSVQIGNLTPDEYRQTGKLAFMFQEATLLPHLNVKQNIEMPLKIKSISDDQRISDLLQAVGLESYAHYMPSQLSGGMKTRVALARSFITKPELLLLDEPFSALDIAWKSKLYVELEKLREQYNSNVIIVTHDVQEALLLTNKVIILGKKGQILGEEVVNGEYSIMKRLGNISQFINSSTFQSLFSSIQKWIMDDAIRG